MAERIVAPNAVAIAGGRVIASPFQFYLDGNDNIRLEGWNICVGTVLQVQGRAIDELGATQAFNMTLPLTADRVVNRRDFAPVRGYILNLVAVAIEADPCIGETFVRISVIRGFTGATIVLGTLLQGHITSQQGLGWPGSPIVNSIDSPGLQRAISMSTPAAGSPLSEAVPTGARWSILALYCVFTASAIAGVRTMYLEHRPGGLGVFASVHPQTVPAGTAASFFWARGMPISSVIVANITCVGLADPMLISAGELVRIGAGNFQVNDQFSDGRLQVLEWLEVQ